MKYRPHVEAKWKDRALQLMEVKAEQYSVIEELKANLRLWQIMARIATGINIAVITVAILVLYMH